MAYVRRPSITTLACLRIRVLSKDNTLPLQNNSSQQLPSQHILVLITQKYLPTQDLLHTNRSQ